MIFSGEKEGDLDFHLKLQNTFLDEFSTIFKHLTRGQFYIVIVFGITGNFIFYDFCF